VPTRHAGRAGVKGSASERKRALDPYFSLGSQQKRLVVFHTGITSRSTWESVAEPLLKTSEEWVVSQINGIEHPGFVLRLGFAKSSDLLSGHRLHLYAIALADRIKELSGVQFSCVRVSKEHGDSTTLTIGEAVREDRRADSTLVTMTTRRSYATPAFAEEVHESTEPLRKFFVPNRPLGLHVSYSTGLPRTWSRLWGPTVAGVLASTSRGGATDSAQIVELGFDHLSVGDRLGHRVQLAIQASDEAHRVSTT
jgi:hypothetical protein